MQLKYCKFYNANISFAELYPLVTSHSATQIILLGHNECFQDVLKDIQVS